MPVPLMTVKATTVNDSQTYLAQLSSDYATTLKSQVEGRVVRVFIQDGDPVHAGQPLIQLDASQQQALAQSLQAASQATAKEVAVIDANRQSALADQNATQAELTFQRTQRDRLTALRTTDSVSTREWEQAETSVKQLEDKLNSLSALVKAQDSRKLQTLAAVQRDQAAARGAMANAGFYTIRAPFSGVLGQVMVKVGDVVGTAMPLTSVTNNRALELEVALPVADKAFVKLGSHLQLEPAISPSGATTSSAPVVVGKAQVFFIAPQVDAMAQTVLVKARIDNPNGRFAADEKLRVRLITGSAQRVLVPFSAITRMAGQPFVYVAKAPDKGSDKGEGLVARMIPVTLGSFYGDSVAVTKGLSDGTRIITGNIQKLQEGIPIQDAATMAPPPSSDGKDHR